MGRGAGTRPGGLCVRVCVLELGGDGVVVVRTVWFRAGRLTLFGGIPPSLVSELVMDEPPEG